MRRLKLLSTAAVLLIFLMAVSASSQNQPGSDLQSIGADSDCFMCHGNQDLEKELPGAPKLSLYINRKLWLKSSHADLGCEACHGTSPHLPTDQVATKAGWQSYTSKLHEVCQTCHPDEWKAFSTSIHATSTNPNAPGNCVGCHNPHEAGLTTRTKMDAVRLCGRCHEHARETYFLSVHGQNLYFGNEKVAACFDCHGYHDVKAVKGGRFSDVELSRICSKCHKGVTAKSVSGWFSHTPITTAQTIMMQLVKLFYIIIIPLTIASMIAHQVLKHRRTMMDRRRAAEDEGR